MFCERCQTRIPSGFSHHYHSRGMRRRELDDKYPRLESVVLHDRLDAESFYESIKLGCFVCRHVWYWLLDWLQSLRQEEAASEPRHRTVVWHDFEGFSNEIADMTRLVTDRSFDATAVLNSGISFKFYTLDFRRDPDIHISGPPSWNQFFDCWRVPGEDARGGCFPTPDSRTLSTSTSSVPQLWDYWFRTCKEKHALCNSLDADHNYKPKRLVRIIPPLDGKAELKWCLAFPGATELVEYVTLSHCWGSHQPYKLTDGNIHHLQHESRAGILPKTYQDAFGVALSLECRHIWIDSLCIIQGNQQDWLEQSPQMASIYGGALCNIAATWASDGTQGCFNTRDPFIVAGTVISLVGPSELEHYYVAPDQLYHRDFHDDGPLNSRGWVVQERCLSKRQLSFTKNQVYWECAELFASEQFPNGLPEDAWKRNPEWNTVSPATPKPRLNYSLDDHNRQSWCWLVEIFSKCVFTQASDKMMALASLARARRQGTGDTYLAGLWKQDLHKQLAWRTFELPGHWTRRSEIYHAPSWSWASTDGPIFTERRYFDPLPHAHHRKIVDIMSATVESDDPDALHSFTAGELRMRAVVTTAICNIDDRGSGIIFSLSCCHLPGSEADLNVHGQPVKYEFMADQPLFGEIMSGQPAYDEFPAQLVNYEIKVQPVNYEVSVQFDNWKEMDSNERSSEFLLVHLSCNGINLSSQGLVLLEVKDGASEQKFKRVGTFNDSAAECWLWQAINFRLGMNLEETTEEDGFQIHLDDPRLADSVRVITVI